MSYTCICMCVLMDTMRSNGSCVFAALSSNSLYSSSSHSLCRVLIGSFSCTGMATLDRSFPMLFFRMFHRLMLLVLGLGEGSKERRFTWGTPFSTQSKSRTDSLDEEDYSWSIRMFWKLSQRYERSTRYNKSQMSWCLDQFWLGLKEQEPESPESSFSFWTSLLKLSMEILSLISLIYESSSEG